MLYAIVAVIALILDQLVKYWTTISVIVDTGYVKLIPGLLHLTNVHNTGAAFSFLQGARWFFVALSVLFVAAVIYMLVKGMGDITEKRSSQFEDHDCDGITIKSYQGQDGLVFSELKSKFSTQKVYEAYQQMTHSFLKMHAMLSLCKDYTLEDVSLHFIAACQCFEDKDQEDGIYERLNKEEQLGKHTFAGKFLRRLIEQHELTVKFGEVASVWSLPLNKSLADKEIKLTLQVTQNYGDNSLVYTY